MKSGDYVRTKQGIIGKVIKEEPFMNDTNIYLDNGKGNITLTSKDGIFKVNRKQEIIKSSPNIIDLIEVGDYVNGMKITNIWKNDETKDIEIEFNEKESYLYVKNWNYESRIENFKIKSIVTKEQIEQMEYKINE